jgi:Domain of unknown function (DUF4157)
MLAQHTNENKLDEVQSEVCSENIQDSKPLLIQPKLSVGAADDPFEHEADAIADRVMRMPDSSFIQRKCVSCEHEEEEQIHRKITPFIQKSTSQTPPLEAGGLASESVTNQINATRGGGNRMPENTLSFMESRFGTDFSGVKIHTDTNAVQMSRELNAQAFTVGSDIYFNEGKYSPDSDSGKHLLAHELTHTVQQGGGIDRKIQRQVNAVEINCGDAQIHFAHDDTTTSYALNHCNVTDGEYDARVRLSTNRVEFTLNETESRVTNFDFGYNIDPGQSSPNTFFRGQNSVRIICTHTPRISSGGLRSIPVIYEMLSALPVAAVPSSHLLAMGDTSWLRSGGSMRWGTYLRPNFWSAMIPRPGMSYADRVLTLNPETDLMSRLGPRIEDEMLLGRQYSWTNRTWTMPDGTVRNFSPAELESIPSLIRRFNTSGVGSLSEIELAMLRRAAELHIGSSSPGSPFASYSVPGETASFLTGNIPDGRIRYRVRILVDNSALDVSGTNTFNEGVYELTNIEEAEIMVTANSNRQIISVERVPTNTAAPEASSFVRGGSAIRWGGRIMLVYGMYHTADRIISSTPQQRPTVMAEETGSWGGGLLGAELGGGACIAFGIATEGLGLLACGLLGGIGMGTLGSELGHTAVQGTPPSGGVIDTVANIPERMSQFEGWLNWNIRGLYGGNF